ncbi:MAG: hypothetical protein WBA67_10180 [Jannaschia sp.]
MIALLHHGFSRFLQDPVAALEEMRDAVPGTPVAASALLAATLVTVLLDFLYGPWAYPHSVIEGGKRADGALIGAAVDVARIYASAAIVWLGCRWLLKLDISGTLAMWMTVPFTIALLLFEVAQFAIVLLFRLTGLDLYGPTFLIGYCGALLVLIASVRVLNEKGDWLSALPVGFAAAVLGHYLPPIVLPVAAGYLIVRRST